MGFQTGTATSFVNLLDSLQAFADAQGWTVNMWAVNSGSDWRLHLQNGSIYANFAATADSCWIVGSTGYNSASAWNAQPGASPTRPRIWSGGVFGAVAWPATYYLFSHSSPASIEVVLRTSPTKYQQLMFGALTKFGTWTGGEYYHGSWGFAQAIGPAGELFRAFSQINETTSLAPVLFAAGGTETMSGYKYQSCRTYLHAEIDSQIWLDGDAFSSSTRPRMNGETHIFPLMSRSVSAFNGLAILQPIWPMMYRPDGAWSCLGRVEHIRYANVINHSAGEVIDIGGQRWMMFPWLEKGGITDASPTVLHAGFAVKYDGP